MPALDAFVTVDEPKWLNRSGNFLAALTNLDWSTTFQKEHPGVTIQWLGLLGYLTRFPDYAEWAGGAITDVVLEARLWEDGLLSALDLLVAGRCLSSEQQPYESHRSMVVMMATGEAAGTAAALCASGGVGPRELDVTQLQRTLVAQGAELRRTFD